MVDNIINNWDLSNEDLISKFGLVDDPDADDLLLGIYYHRGLFREKDLDMAEKCFLEAVEKGIFKALNSLGVLYYEQEKYDLAEKYFLVSVVCNRTGEKKSLNDALYNLGNLYNKQEKYNLAEKYYLKAILCNETYKKGHNNALNCLGNLYYRQEKYDLAEEYYLKAIENGYTRALNNLGVLYNRQKKYDLAEEYFLEAVEKNVDEALNNLGRFYKKTGKYSLKDVGILLNKIKQLEKEKLELKLSPHPGELYLAAKSEFEQLSKKN